MDKRANAFLRHQQQRWLRADAARWVRPDAAKFVRAGTRLADVYPALALKYNENQPRVPAGNGRESGRWGDGGSGRPRVYITGQNDDAEEAGGGGLDLSLPIRSIDFGDILSEIDKLDLFDIKPREGRNDGVRLAGDLPEQLPEIVVTPGEGNTSSDPGIGHNQGPPLEDPPEILRVRPERSKNRTAVQRRIGAWLGQALRLRRLLLVAVFRAFMDAVPWLRPYYDRIETYRDPPRPLEELQQSVNSPRVGTEIHHVIEQQALEKLGFAQKDIDAPENRVRIPILKHYEITAWYVTPNPIYGGLTPRDYLADKPMAVRRQMGLDALRRAGVLK